MTRSLFHVLVAAGAGATLALMLYVGDPEQAGWWPGFLAFAAWALLPYLVANRLAAGLWSSPPASAVLLVGALLWVGGSAWVLTDAFFVHPDPQSTIVFAVLPAVQLVAWMLVYVAARALRTPGTG